MAPDKTSAEAPRNSRLFLLMTSSGISISNLDPRGKRDTRGAELGVAGSIQFFLGKELRDLIGDLEIVQVGHQEVSVAANSDLR